MLRAILVRELWSKGCRSPDLSPLRRFGQGPSCSPHQLVNQSAMLKEESVHGCRGAKYKTYCLLDVEGVLLFFVPEAMKLVEPLTLNKNI